MTLLERLTQDYKQAMRDHDPLKKSVLNFLLAQIKNKEIDTQKDIEESDIISLIKKEIKNIGETIGYLQQAQKHEAIPEEEEKKAFLQSYLPEVLSKQQTQDLITGLVSQLGIEDLKTQRGLLMKELMAAHKSDIDPQLVNEIINSMLQ